MGKEAWQNVARLAASRPHALPLRARHVIPASTDASFPISSSPFPASKGFTLIELLVVMAIVGLAATAVLLTLPDGDAALYRQAETFGLQLRHARDEAILGMRTVEVAVTARGYGFSRRRFDGWQPLDGRAFAAVDWAPGTQPQLPRRDARMSFRFDPTGAAEPGSLVLLREGRRMQVTVDDGGEVTVDGRAR